MMMIMMIIMITRPRVDKVKPKVWFKYYSGIMGWSQGIWFKSQRL